MQCFENTTDFFVAHPSAVTLGKFDGIHKGHQKLMERILQRGSEGLKSLVFTINPRQEALIMTRREQKEYLEKLGIDYLIDCPFVPEIFRLSPEQFIDEILIRRLNAAYIAVGADFCFGYQRAGTAMFLKEYASRKGIEVDIIEKETWEGREISSSYIREALSVGDMQLVKQLMGRAYCVSGEVVHGRHLGTKMGMPTANIIPEAEKLLPPRGVYMTYCTLEDGLHRPAVTNIGTKPTVDGSFVGLESYLLDTDMDLYGKKLSVELLFHERGEFRFASIDELKDRISKDILFGKEYFAICSSTDCG